MTGRAADVAVRYVTADAFLLVAIRESPQFTVIAVDAEVVGFEKAFVARRTVLIGTIDASLAGFVAFQAVV